MTDEEKQRAKESRRQELRVLKAELADLKPGRAVYVHQLGGGSSHAVAAAGHVFFKTTNAKDLTRLKSELERELKKLQ